MGFEQDFTRIVRSPNHKGRTPSNARVVALIVHDEEYPERDSAAEDVANFFSRTSTQASVTGIFDNNSSVGCVDYGLTAWHSGAGDPWNFMCEGYENSGYAKQTRDEWLDAYGISMLELLAAHVAKRCLALGIPIRKIDHNQLRRAINANDPSQGGICGHHDITLAAGIYGGHWDPGPNFPWDYFIERVLAHAGGTAGPVTPIVKDPVVTPTNSGPIPAWTGFSEQTKIVQGFLAEIGIDPGPIDGIYGSRTENAVILFQNKALDTEGRRLEVDGICGPKTFASLVVCVYLKRVGDQTPPPPETMHIPRFQYQVSIGTMHDTVVKRVQLRLRDRGWLITVDGDFGPATESVVRQFQTEKQLVSDGIVGPATWAELFRTDNVT